MQVEIISATRKSEADFQSKTALGISLLRLCRDSRLVARISFENSRGLPELYNERLAAADSESIVVFMHDDIWIDDHFFSQRLIEGLNAYDIIGVAGNRRRIERQPAWAFINREFTWDSAEYLSGAVAHAKRPFGLIAYFGDTPAPCELLDGVLLAAKKSVLTEKKVLFDPRFDFHFYDMDFCRTARRNGATLGTWPICITHESDGAYGTEQWAKGYRLYLEKWGS